VGAEVGREVEDEPERVVEQVVRLQRERVVERDRLRRGRFLKMMFLSKNTTEEKNKL
jgi:hypothetical protein